MASKYDQYWRKRLEEIKDLIKEAHQKGTSNEIDISDIKKLGNRDSWSTKVIIRPGIRRITEDDSPDAHGKSLGNVIIQSGILRNVKETIVGKISSREGKLFLHFEIVRQQNHVTVENKKEVKSTSQDNNIYRSQMVHDERCLICKETIKLMLEKIYGQVEQNYKFKIGTHPEDFWDIPYYDKLREIYEVLQNHRGFKEFVKAKTLPNCDFFIPEPAFIVEFDERQHFTEPRRIALEMYPEDLEFGFDIKRWIELCEKINAKDNDPPYRDEQRAWYDTLRDFLPAIQGLKPTIRLFAKDYVWCNLDPNNPSDVKKFENILNRRL